MTRRQATIAAIAATAGAVSKAYGQVASVTTEATYGFAPVIWDIPETVTDYGVAPSKPEQRSEYLITAAVYPRVPVEFALIIRHKGREVKLTPEQIMDALEGK